MNQTTHIRVILDNTTVEDRRNCEADEGLPLLNTAVLAASIGFPCHVTISSEEVFEAMGGQEQLDELMAEVPNFSLDLNTDPEFWS